LEVEESRREFFAERRGEVPIYKGLRGFYHLERLFKSEGLFGRWKDGQEEGSTSRGSSLPPVDPNQDGLASQRKGSADGSAGLVPRSIAMPDIGNLGNLSSSVAAGYAASIRTTGEAAARRTADSAPAAPTRSGDRVEVSEVARWLDEMNRLPAIREDKVASAKAAIANGSLDTDEKLAIAISRMIEEL